MAVAHRFGIICAGMFAGQYQTEESAMINFAQPHFAQPHFAEPRWLWLAVLGPLLLVALQIYAARARRGQLTRIAAPEVVANLTRSHSPARRAVKNLMLMVGVMGVGLAMARPQWGVREITSQNLSEDIV